MLFDKKLKKKRICKTIIIIEQMLITFEKGNLKYWIH